MHNLHPGAKLHPGCIFCHVNGVLRICTRVKNLHCIGCKFAPTFEVEQIYLDPGTNLHPGANCAYEHGLSVEVFKLQPSV